MEKKQMSKERKAEKNAKQKQRIRIHENGNVTEFNDPRLGDMRGQSVRRTKWSLINIRRSKIGRSKRPSDS